MLPLLVIVGQTPPPWHGQAVATKLLFEAPWDGFEVRTVRMAFSEEMQEIGRFQWRKILHIWDLRREIVSVTQDRRDGILLYPPASPNWVPLLRDLLLLPFVRGRFRHVVYLYHAGGVGGWLASSGIRRRIAKAAYGRASLSLEVAREIPSPHEILGTSRWAWTPYGVEAPPPVPRHQRAQGPFRVLFVGSLQLGKGVVEVLRTASLLKKGGFGECYRFSLVGRWFSDEFEESVRHLQAELELEDMVEFPGQLTGEDKWQAYAEADLFFFPTHYESEAFPLVLIEALACGLPVVTTRWRGIPDLVEGCPVASLCDIHAPDQYAAAIESWRLRRDSRQQTASEARNYYETRYRPGDFLEQMRALLQYTVGRDEKPLSFARPPVGSDRFRQHYPSLERLSVRAYLADQNPGYDRSFGISRMSQVVLDVLHRTGQLELWSISSKTSQQSPENFHRRHILPWGTRSKFVRLLTDHLHPLFARGGGAPDVYYFPKGYLPWLSSLCRPAVVTIHDTIIQYDEDHYPRWRSPWEYGYWARMLRHTLRHADAILTVSETSKRQIEAFMARHALPAKPITVTYEPCLYEQLPQPENPPKENYVIHLASCEPHKRSAHLVRWWHEAELRGHNLPTLHLIGNLPPEVEPLLAHSRSIVKRPFLSDESLQAAYLGATALILPSEIEGFGLPALEAYYLGTPVCFVRDTSVEEVLAVATTKGGFRLDDSASLLAALEEVSAMSPEEVRTCGLKLREIYAAEKVAARMLKVFEEVSQR